MSARIGVSPLTGRVFRGRVNKAGNAFVGEKQDITSDVLRTVVEKADFHGGSFEIECGADKWTVTVTKQSAKRRPQDDEAFDGVAASGCNYSPCVCETCGACPCDGSC